MSVAAANGGVAVAVPVVPVPVVAGEVPTPSNAPGISEEQLKVWREKFKAKIAEQAEDARSLMSMDKAELIVDLLRNWDSLTVAQKKAKTPNYAFFKRRYVLSGESDLIKAEADGMQRRVVKIDELFDELLPYHLGNNHAKGLGLFKRVGPVMAHVTKSVCIAFCADCPVCLKQVRNCNTVQLFACRATACSLPPPHYCTEL